MACRPPPPRRPGIGAGPGPRRVQLLAQLGLTPAEILPADIDETERRAELPEPYAERMAREKAAAVAILRPAAAVLAADTVVAVGRRILPKAESPDDVRRCLELISGRRHRVLTGVALQLPDEDGQPQKLRARLSVTQVRVAKLTPAQIDAYVDSGQGIGVAGGYKFQHFFASYIPWIGGSNTGIVGLPLFETAQLLRGAGYL